jgi:perosamine synthetase
MRTLARQHRLTIIDDAAHALGSAIGRQAIGGDRLTDMTCFSFYATKNLTTGEGGMVTCGDTRMAGRIRRLSLHGLSRDAWKRYSRGGTWRYDVVDLGFKYNLTDVAAGIGLAQIAKFRTMQRTRRRLALEYTRLLRAQEAFELPAEVPGTTHAWHLYVIRLRPRVLRLDRAALIEALRVRGIGTSVHFMPLHLFSFYRRTFGYRSGSYPHTERESARVISLPLYPGLADADQGRVVDVLFETARRYRR